MMQSGGDDGGPPKAPPLPEHQCICPACGRTAECEMVDNGVGMQQVSAFHCYDCGWTEGGDDPHNIRIVSDDDEPLN